MEFVPLKSGSAGNLYQVHGENYNIAIEAGIPISEINRLLWGLPPLFLISHEHGDHARAVLDVLKRGSKVYTSKGTAAALGINGDHRVDTSPQYVDEHVVITPFLVRHDAAEPVGFLVCEQDGGDKLFFATDTGAALAPTLPPCDIIAVECNYQFKYLVEAEPYRKKRVRKNHMGLEDCIALLGSMDLCRAREIHLLHGSTGYADADECVNAVEDETGIPTYWCAWTRDRKGRVNR